MQYRFLLDNLDPRCSAGRDIEDGNLKLKEAKTKGRAIADH